VTRHPSPGPFEESWYTGIASMTPECVPTRAVCPASSLLTRLERGTLAARLQSEKQCASSTGEKCKPATPRIFRCVAVAMRCVCVCVCTGSAGVHRTTAFRDTPLESIPSILRAPCACDHLHGQPPQARLASKDARSVVAGLSSQKLSQASVLYVKLDSHTMPEGDRHHFHLSRSVPVAFCSDV